MADSLAVDASSLLQRGECLSLDGSSSAAQKSAWSWCPHVQRSPPSVAALDHLGFGGSMWAKGNVHAPNLLLLLHGLGDQPGAFAKFASTVALPQTSALALAGPVVLPAGLPGRCWFESFEADGTLIDGTRLSSSRRRADSLASLHSRLLRLLDLLERGCGWPCVCALEGGRAFAMAASSHPPPSPQHAQ